MVKATIIEIKPAYNLWFSIKKNELFSIIYKSLTIIGVNTAKGMYLNEFLVEGDTSLEIIPDIGINLIKKVITPHIMIPYQIIFFCPI